MLDRGIRRRRGWLLNAEGCEESVPYRLIETSGETTKEDCHTNGQVFFPMPAIKITFN